MLKNILSLLVGSAGSQVIALLTAPVITRIYPPNEFGMMATAWALIGLGGVIACLSYEKAIVLEKDDHRASQLVLLCLYLSLVTAIGLAFVAVFFNTFVFPDYFSIEYVFHFMFFGIFILGVQRSIDFFATRKKRFHIIAVSFVIASLVAASSKIFMGYWVEATAEILLLGNVLSISLATILLLTFMRKSLIWNIWPTDTRRAKPCFLTKIDLLKKYSDFPKKQIPNALLNAFQQEAPIFILAAYFSSAIVGFYGLAAMVLLRPAMALSAAVSRVYLQRLSIIEPEKMKGDLIKITASLAGIAAPACIVLAVWGEELFTLLFGEKWGEAGRMAALLAPWIFIVIAKAPATQVLIAKRELGYILWFSAVYLVVRVTGLVSTIYFTDDVYHAVLVFSLIGFAANVIYIKKGVKVASYV